MTAPAVGLDSRNPDTSDNWKTPPANAVHYRGGPGDAAAAGPKERPRAVRGQFWAFSGRSGPDPEKRGPRIARDRRSRRRPAPGASGFRPPKAGSRGAAVDGLAGRPPRPGPPGPGGGRGGGAGGLLVGASLLSSPCAAPQKVRLSRLRAAHKDAEADDSNRSFGHRLLAAAQSRAVYFQEVVKSAHAPESSVPVAPATARANAAINVARCLEDKNSWTSVRRLI